MAGLAGLSIGKLHARFFEDPVLKAGWVTKNPASASICDTLMIAAPGFPATWAGLETLWGQGISNVNTKKIFHWHEGDTVFTSPTNEPAWVRSQKLVLHFAYFKLNTRLIEKTKTIVVRC